MILYISEHDIAFSELLALDSLFAWPYERARGLFYSLASSYFSGNLSVYPFLGSPLSWAHDLASLLAKIKVIAPDGAYRNMIGSGHWMLFYRGVKIIVLLY